MLKSRGLPERTRIHRDKRQLMVRTLIMERQPFDFRNIDFDKPVLNLEILESKLVKGTAPNFWSSIFKGAPLHRFISSIDIHKWSIFLGRPFIWSRKRRGNRVEPCGRPALIGTTSEDNYLQEGFDNWEVSSSYSIARLFLN